MKVILHLGLGKTGTSSIQKALRENREDLRKHGVRYLGMMLEDSGLRKYKWQKRTSVVPEFYELSEEEAYHQVMEILEFAIQKAGREDVETLIWSNESLLGKKESLMRVCKSLKEKGVDVQIVLYLRDYYSWMHSAYIQWGIKDKIYEGKTKKFTDFSKMRPPRFYQVVKFFYDRCPESLMLRSMEGIDDVVKDFFEIIGINYPDKNQLRANERPSYEELFLRAIFNNEYMESVLPKEFERSIDVRFLEARSPEAYIKELFPTEAEFEESIDPLREDLENLNKVLELQGQKKLPVKMEKYKNVEFDEKRLLLMLTQIVMRQAKRITELEDKINVKKRS